MDSQLARRGLHLHERGSTATLTRRDLRGIRRERDPWQTVLAPIAQDLASLADNETATEIKKRRNLRKLIGDLKRLAIGQKVKVC